MENQYPPSGSLFTNETKKSENSPDYSGYLELDAEVMEDFIKQKQNNQSKVSMDLVGWKKVAKSGKAFLRVIANVRKEKKKPF